MGHQYGKRIARLLVGLLISAVGIVMMLQANIGVDPWNVLHMGLNLVTGISIGMVTIFAGAAAILISVILGERIGIGTIGNIVITGFMIDGILALGFIRQQTSLWMGILMMLAGLELLTLGTYYYMSSELGTGPRDALMVAVARKVHIPVGICRSAIEVVIVVAGWLLGGSVGVGTVISAFGIGLFFQVNFTLLHFKAAELHQETLAETADYVMHRK